MSIRTATTKDIAQISTLVKSLSHLYLDVESSNDQLPEWFSNTLTNAEFERRVTSDNYQNFVFEREDEKGREIVGYISLKGDSHLYHLFVSGEYQGQGIASKLWRYVLSQSTSQNYSLRSSLYAIPVYQKFGFKITGDVQSKDGIRFQAMELNLQQAAE